VYRIKPTPDPASVADSETSTGAAYQPAEHLPPLQAIDVAGGVVSVGAVLTSMRRLFVASTLPARVPGAVLDRGRRGDRERAAVGRARGGRIGAIERVADHVHPRPASVADSETLTGAV
jgi:hypothetical protein